MELILTDCIKKLSPQYPQLALPLAEGNRNTQLYRDAVLKGLPVGLEPDFFGSPADSYVRVTTAVGEIGILSLGDRRDFEHAYCALANKCEPMEILPSVGAVYLGGLTNWEKIRAHKREYFANGGPDWPAEFRRFTADKKNYQDKLILLSGGYYSGISPEQVALPPDQWKEKSLVIRKYHELTHFIYRAVYPEDKDAIRDEVLADYIGIRQAFGHYVPAVARLSLGVEEIPGPAARIRHYVPEEKLAQAVRRAEYWINLMSKLDECIMTPYHDLIIMEEPQ